MKCTVHSDSGSAMIIPQGHNVVRIYIQFATTEDHSKEWKLAPLSSIQDKANQILKPYKIEWEHVDWHSVYPIGQALVDRYTLDERIFIGGDACHTHSVRLM